jgi:hypothetical protein
MHYLEPTNNKVKVRINNYAGTLTRSSQEPIFGTFYPDEGPLAPRVIYRVMERSVWGAIMGRKQFFNDNRERVKVDFL